MLISIQIKHKKLIASKIKYLFYVVCLFISFHSFSQNKILRDTVSAFHIIDSLLIDRDLNNWSARLYTNIKGQGFKFQNEKYHLNFTPNNLYGIGVGVATSKITVDIGYNLKNKNKEKTDRFGLQAELYLNKNIINFFVQSYKGFNVKNSIDDNVVFRNDIKSTAIGVDYLFLTNRKDFSASLMRSGLKGQLQNIVSFGIGGFAIYNHISGNQPLLPEDYYPYFNYQARIIDFNNFGVGVLIGVVSAIKLSANLYLALHAKGGVGLASSSSLLEDENNYSNTARINMLYVSALLEYKWKRFYANSSAGVSGYATKMEIENQGKFLLGNGKFVIGYKIKDN